MKFIFLILLVVIIYSYPQNPVIGIYTQDADYPGYQNFTYIAASYVKSMEMAGAQVIPIFYHYTNAQLTQILSQINGVLFPGGEMPIDLSNQWTQKTKFILEYAMNQNNLGNPYPIWATCLGQQTIAYITSLNSNNMSTLTQVHGQIGLTRKLIMKSNNSVLFKDMPQSVLNQIVSGEGVYYFHHRWAVMLSTFENSVPLKNYWNLISTSVSPVGEQFVSTMEAKNYPFFLSQYHPQKNSYEWRKPASRTYEAIRAQQLVFNTFIQYARQNKNRFTDLSYLTSILIYNYDPVYTTPDYDFVQIYVFNEQDILNLKKSGYINLNRN